MTRVAPRRMYRRSTTKKQREAMEQYKEHFPILSTIIWGTARVIVWILWVCIWFIIISAVALITMWAWSVWF